MWIGLIIGGFGAGIGLVAAMVAPLLTVSGPLKYLGLAISIPVVLILTLVFSIVYKKVFKPLMVSDHLLATGVPTPGKLLKIWETGTMVNQRPLVGMSVEVNPPRLGTPYTVDTKSVLSLLEISKYQPGAPLRLRVDPENKMNVAVEGVAS